MVKRMKMVIILVLTFTCGDNDDTRRIILVTQDNWTKAFDEELDVKRDDSDLRPWILLLVVYVPWCLRHCDPLLRVVEKELFRNHKDLSACVAVAQWDASTSSRFQVVALTA